MAHATNFLTSTGEMQHFHLAPLGSNLGCLNAQINRLFSYQTGYNQVIIKCGSFPFSPLT